MKTDLYILFLTVFILRVAFTAIPFDNVYVQPYPLSSQVVTVQFWLWRLFMLLVEMSFIVVLYTESKPANRRGFKILLFIQGWYIIEYLLHYSSIWITWKNLGVGSSSEYDGLSSHLMTMLIFAMLCRPQHST